MNKRNWGKLRHWFWPMLAAITLLLRALATLNPTVTNTVYRNGIYQAYTWVMDLLFGWLPFPLFFVLPFFLIWFIWKRWKTWRSRGRWALWSFTDAICMLLVWFLWSWGFNYTCPNLKELNHWNLTTSSPEELFALVDKCGANIVRLNETKGPFPQVSTDQVEARIPAIRSAQKQWIAEVGLSNFRNVPVHAVLPAGSLHALDISGIYLPFTAQGHADAGAHWVPLTFTLAHEMSHGYGITDEGEANLAAFACLYNSGEPTLEYVAWITLLRHALGQFRRLDPEHYPQVKGSCPPVALELLEQIKRHQLQYEPLFPEVSEAMNDAFLKQQGVQSGVSSYNELVALVYASGTLK